MDKVPFRALSLWERESAKRRVRSIRRCRAMRSYCKRADSTKQTSPGADQTRTCRGAPVCAPCRAAPGEVHWPDSPPAPRDAVPTACEAAGFILQRGVL